MDEDGLPIVGAAIDLTKVAPIDPKRTLAFLNHFICHTMNFLNKFSAVCETKLEDVSIRVQRMETSLSILESKLASIPGLDDISMVSTVKSDVTETSPIGLPTPQTTHSDASSAETPEVKKIAVQEKVEPAVNASETVEQQVKQTVAQDERYAKYLKMVQVGVPAMALRPKMIAEGLDPDLLSNPNAEAPSSTKTKSMPLDSGSSSNDSDSDFSD